MATSQFSSQVVPVLPEAIIMTLRTIRSLSTATTLVVICLLANTGGIAAQAPDLRIDYKEDKGATVIAWHPPTGKATYDIYRNGDHIGSTMAATFTDQDGVPGAHYTVVAMTGSEVLVAHATGSGCSAATIFFHPGTAPFLTVTVNEECLQYEWLTPSGESGQAAMGSWSEV